VSIEIGLGACLKSRWSNLLLTHVSVKSELILSSKLCPNFRVAQVCNRDYSSKFDAAPAIPAHHSANFSLSYMEKI